MDDLSAAAVRKPCCVCDEPGGQHCTKCKSRHYCGKACQLVDWYEREHKAQCKQLAADFQDRLLDALMPEKLKIKEAPPIVGDAAPAAGSTSAARLSAVQTQTTAMVKTGAVHGNLKKTEVEAPGTSGAVEDVVPADGSKAAPAARTTAMDEVTASAFNEGEPNWRRGTCAICLDLLDDRQTFYDCCCKTTCKDCSTKCKEYDNRCPFCRAPTFFKSPAEWVRRVQKHADEGNAEAQVQLGDAYHDAWYGLKKSMKRAVHLYERAAAQGYAKAEYALGDLYELGDSVKINYTTAALWYRRAADRGYPAAQVNLGSMFYKGMGVALSYDEAVKWWRLGAAQGDKDALFNLGECHEEGRGVPQDDVEALRWFKRAKAKGDAGAAAAVDRLKARIARCALAAEAA